MEHPPIPVILNPEKGYTISEAQHISNIANQMAETIQQELEELNCYKKVLDIDGVEHVLMKGEKLDFYSVEDKLQVICELRSLQAYLMTGIKAKKQLLDHYESLEYTFNHFIIENNITYPSLDEIVKRPDIEMFTKGRKRYIEDYDHQYLSDVELNEYLSVEAHAAHIGKFIHNNGKLHRLRKSLNSLQDIEFIELEDGKKTVVKIIKEDTPSNLQTLHNTLAAKHRNYEKRVNYFKHLIAERKNKEIVELASKRAEIFDKYNKEVQEFNRRQEALANEHRAQYNIKLQKFTKEKIEKIDFIAGLKVALPDKKLIELAEKITS